MGFKCFLDPYQPHDFVRRRQFRRVHSIKGWTFWCRYQGLIKNITTTNRKIWFRPSAQKPVFLLFVSVEWRFAMKTSKRQKRMFFIGRKKERLKDFICKLFVDFIFKFLFNTQCNNINMSKAYYWLDLEFDRWPIQMTSAPGSYPVGSGKSRTSNPHHLIVEQKALQISKEFSSLIREAVSSSKSSEILRTSHKQFAQV